MRFFDLMNSTKLTKDKKGYTLIHQGKVLVNGLNVDDIYSIIPELSIEDIQNVREGTKLSVKGICKLSIQEMSSAAI
jgi:hypothetical protein